MSRIPGTRVIFSPKGGTSKELVRLIKAARGEIAVAAYAFSSKYLGKALSEAIKRGVKVRILLDGDNARKAYSIDEWLAGEGIDVRFIEIKRGCLHHKFMLIDGKVLVTGSYNFTNESEFRNHEAAIFTNNKALIQSFAAEFDRLWCLCNPVGSTDDSSAPAESTTAPNGTAAATIAVNSTNTDTGSIAPATALSPSDAATSSITGDCSTTAASQSPDSAEAERPRQASG